MVNLSDIKHSGDVLSATVVVGTLAQWLPSIAALFTIVWTLIRIYETKTVQRFLGRAVVDPALEGDDE